VTNGDPATRYPMREKADIRRGGYGIFDM
jgi:hypothetical protein